MTTLYFVCEILPVQTCGNIIHRVRGEPCPAVVVRDGVTLRCIRVSHQTQHEVDHAFACRERDTIAAAIAGSPALPNAIAR